MSREVDAAYHHGVHDGLTLAAGMATQLPPDQWARWCREQSRGHVGVICSVCAEPHGRHRDTLNGRWISTHDLHRERLLL